MPIEKHDIESARERLAKVAELAGQHQFAREVRAGAWDHRTDVQAAFRGERLKGEEDIPACCICGGPLYLPGATYKHGNNATPVVPGGRCCNYCDNNVVTPERIKLMKAR